MIRRFLSVFYPELKIKVEPTLTERVRAEADAVDVALLAAHNEQERAIAHVAMLSMRRARLDGAVSSTTRLKGVA